jgi:hypothetical protein
MLLRLSTIRFMKKIKFTTFLNASITKRFFSKVPQIIDPLMRKNGTLLPSSRIVQNWAASGTKKCTAWTACTQIRQFFVSLPVFGSHDLAAFHYSAILPLWHWSELTVKWPVTYFQTDTHWKDRLCGLVIRVPGYRSRGPGFDSRRYQIFWEVVGLERRPLSLVRITEQLLERKVEAPV